ncbi:MAG: dihydrofolate reductase [Defluviitaleaceae bacterium]|nr:dihydrofolate reductase [Defluviitaleaceae bacterium]
MLSCIAAVGQNNELGKNGKLPWHIKEDLQYFKETTLGKTIIMGRVTFESLPQVLPDRKHIVITQNPNFFVNDRRVEVLHSIEDLKDLENRFVGEEEAFVIGGGQIYSALLPMCKRLYITRIHKNFDADTHFPHINPNKLTLLSQSQKKYNQTEKVFFTFEIWELN